MKKSLNAVLALWLLLATVLCSCKAPETGEMQTDVSNSIVTSDADVSDTAPSLSMLPERNFDGYEFVITYRDSDTLLRDMSFDENSQDVLEVAKYKRALAVEEAYKVELVPSAISGDWTGEKALDAILANDGESYDIIMPHAIVGWNVYITAGFALEWTENMKYNQLDAPWWDQNARECLSFEGKLYTMMGDNSWLLLGSSVGILFNKNVFDENDVDYPYEAVKQKTWTFDRFFEIANETKADLNGDGVMDPQTDRYGYTTSLFLGPIGFLWTTGGSIVDKDQDDIPYINLYNETTVELYERFFEHMNEEGFHIYGDRDSFHTDFHKEFAAGHVVMIDTMISNLDQLRDMENFGIVPYPMYDETVGEYHSTVDAGVHNPIIPYNAPDPDRTSILLEALTIEGYNQVLPAFYETTLKIKYTDDDADKDMLDMIRASRTFDFGYYTNATDKFTTLGTNLFMSNMSFTKYYESNILAAEATLERFIETMRDNT